MRQGTSGVGVVRAVRHAAVAAAIAVGGLVALAIPMGLAEGQAAAALPMLPDDFSTTISVTDTPDSAVSSIQLYVDHSHERARADFLGAAGENLGSLWVFFDKDSEYLVGSATNQCGKTAVPSGGMTAPFGWLDDGAATQLPSGAIQANDPSSVLGPNYVFSDVLRVMGDTGTAGPLDLTMSASGLVPKAMIVDTATINFSAFASGQPDVSVFNLPAACASPTQPEITQFPPTSGTISYGDFFSSQLQAAAYPFSPVTYVTTSSSPLEVSPEGVVSAPGAPLAPGSYTVSGADTDTLGDVGTWSFTLTVAQQATSLVAKPVGANLAIHPKFSATLTRADDGSPIAGRTVSFTYRGHALCSAVTAINGVASCHYPGIDIFILRSEYNATFAGDADYVGSASQARV